MQIRRHLAKTYLSIDPRSLALFRVVFATVLLFDVYWRSRDVDYFYTNEGLLPNHTVLWAAPARRMFSFFFMASTAAEARVAMALCALVFLLLLVGYRTRLMQVLSWICLISLNTRICLLENGGDIVLNQLATWTLFLPLGRRFSLDALLASLRAREEHSAAEVADRAPLRANQAEVVSIAVLAIVLQVFVIYLFNVLHKNGLTWHNGTAVHLTLHQDRLLSIPGEWIRDYAPSSLLVALTYVTLVVEGLGAALVISPFFPVYTRGVAVILMPLLHLNFALCMDLGPFSYAMFCCFALLVHERHWEWLSRFFARRGQRLRCFFDADCGICFFTVRVLARMDVFDRVRFVSNKAVAELPPGVGPDLVERTVVVLDEKTGRVSMRSDAAAEIFRALPFGWPLFVLFKLPGLRALASWIYDRVAANRTAVSQWFGLAACGVPSAPGMASPAALPSGPARLRARAGRVANELLCGIVLVAAIGETLTYNAAVPAYLHYPQPDALQALIDYGRLIQSWRMFAPDAPDTDLMLSVEAKTSDGRLVDPYNEVASRQKRVPFRAIPSRLGNDQFFTTYSLIIPTDQSRPYWSAFEQWILNYPLRTNNPKDRIVSYTAYVITDRSPPLGHHTPSGFAKQAFLSYPH